MKKNVKLLFLMALLPFAIFAQDEQPKHRNLKLAFEVGTNIKERGIAKPEQIRENQSTGSYGDSFYNYGFFGGGNLLHTTYFGIKPEYFFHNNRIGIASGVRFTTASSKLVSDRDNFLWRINEDDLTTDFVRINDIRHKSYLLGIPLEFRIFPNKKQWAVQPYIKAGTSFNFRIHSRNQVNFTDKAMEKYEDVVSRQLSENNNFSAFLYAGAGLKIGRHKADRWSPWVNVDFQFPYFMLTENSFAFIGKYNDIDLFPGGGFQLSFQIPIGKNVPIGSN